LGGKKTNRKDKIGQTKYGGKIIQKGLVCLDLKQMFRFLARKEQIAKPNMAGKFEEPVFFLE